MKRRLLALLVAVMMLVAMIPSAAFAAEVSTSDPYTATVTTVDVDDDFTDYTTTVTVSLNSDGTLAGITVGYDSSNDEYGDNQTYIDYALGGRTRGGVEYSGLISQLSGKTLSEIAAMESIDAVSGATCSSDAIFEAVQAIAAANTASDDTSDSAGSTAEEGYVYVLMNVPYADFYAALGVESVDAVSSATLNKSRTVTQTMAGGAYHVSSDGSDITGITYYVYIAESLLDESLEVTDETTVSYTVTNRGTESTYGGSGADSLVEAPSYSYYVVDETPSYYLTASAGSDGSLVFSFVGEVTETYDSVSYDLYSDTSYGDYQLDLDEEIVSSFLGDDYISAVTLTTTDGTVYGLRHVENIWKGYELAWSVGYTTTVHGSTVDSTTYAGLEGATIATVTYYTTTGVYVLNLDDATCTPYANDVTAVLNEDETITISGIPTDAENLSVSLSYTSGKTSYEVDATYADGVLTPAESLIPETTYTITITADNYSFNSLSVTSEEGVYVLMNVPYSDFYSVLGDDDVDVVSSATLNKTRTQNQTIAGGSYHVNSDGSDITGVIYYVYISENALSSLNQITDDSSVTIEVTNRGTTTETTYEGSDALFEAASYSYYIVDETPSYYLTATGADGSVSFVSLIGEETAISDVSFEITSDTTYGDYQLDIDEETITGILGEDGYVTGVTLTDSDGNVYGLRHVENIWKGYELAWSVGYTTTVHGCTIDSTSYAALEGATITTVTYYTTTGIYVLTLADGGAYCTPYAKGVTAVSKSDGTIAVSGIPSDAENLSVTLSYTESKTTYEIETTYADGILTIADVSTLPEDTTLTITITADNYAFESIEIEYGYNYVLMNIPYEVFYAALGAENVDGVDAITAATSSKYNYYNLAAGSYNGGDADIDGVTYVVKLSAADYEAFVALGYTEVTSAAETVTVISQRVDYDISGIDTLFVQGDYAYAVTAPQDGYLEATVSGGSVVFGTFTYEVTEVTVSYDFYTDTSYGDYQLDLDISDYVSDMLNVSAVTVNTSDGCSYALLHVEEIWTGSKLAWSTGHTTTVHQNVVQYQLYEGMEGKTITSVTYYMTDGTVYEFVLDSSAYVTPYAEGVAAELSEDQSCITISGIPSDAENVSVTLSYTEGSGKNATTVSVEATYADGVLTPAEALTVLTEYTITITADNYAFEDLTVEVPFLDDDGSGDWSWASDYIYALADEGIINGFTDGTYLPTSTLTRAQAAKIIAEAMGLTSEATTSQFTDVSDSHWALTYIEACADAGIITGIGDGTFNPDGEVTRAQLATMIARALAYDLTDTESSFSDVSGYYVAYVEACVNNGVVNGYGDGTFLPGNSVKRSEAAKMIAVAFGYVEE